MQIPARGWSKDREVIGTLFRPGCIRGGTGAMMGWSFLKTRGVCIKSVGAATAPTTTIFAMIHQNDGDQAGSNGGERNQDVHSEWSLVMVSFFSAQSVLIEQLPPQNREITYEIAQNGGGGSRLESPTRVEGNHN